MAKYICKFQDNDKDYFLEWSTIVDAPVTRGMSKDDFIDYYLGKYGSSSANELMDRLERASKKGTSCFIHKSLDELISVNRAGPDESEATYEDILNIYCR